MGFQEHILSMTDETRLEFLNNLKKFGEPGVILNELLTTPPCVSTKKLDIRINQNYMLVHDCKTFWHDARTSLFRLDTIKYYYHIHTRKSDASIIGLIKNDYHYRELQLPRPQDAVTIANALRRYVKGFENTEPYTPEEKANEVSFPYPLGTGYYVFRNNALYLDTTSIFKKSKSRVLIEDLNDVIWCYQYFASESEASDTYAAKLYLRKAKCKTVDIFFATHLEGFQFLLELKKRVPHLVYGYNEAYEQIHKRNPEELMAIAKNLSNQTTEI